MSTQGLLLLCCLSLGLSTGCAQRELTINSEPQGALVYLNGQEVGRTPMKYDFRWYGDYEVTLRADGYETLKTHRKIYTPIYGFPPFDLGAELFGVKDRREWTFQLQRADAAAADPQALINRGNALKADLRSSQFTRSPATAPSTQPTK
jgi:hypothetical protein